MRRVPLRLPRLACARGRADKAAPSGRPPLDAARRRLAFDEVLVVFPDGSRVRASSIIGRRVDDPERSYGLYLDPGWQPTWPATLIEWEDFGLPLDQEMAVNQIEVAFERARRGELVEVGCVGGRGRTGTVLACMAVLAGVPARDAVAWVRSAYHPGAVETVEQEAWVQWFAHRIAERGGSRDHPCIAGRTALCALDRPGRSHELSRSRCRSLPRLLSGVRWLRK